MRVSDEDACAFLVRVFYTLVLVAILLHLFSG